MNNLEVITPEVITPKKGDALPPNFIATHSGNFHADDVLAVAMLTKLPRYSNMTLIRTRDQEVLDKAEVVMDVGGVFDPTTHRFDHHQTSFNETFNEEKKTLMSSAGLIWKYFGFEILKSLTFDVEDDGSDWDGIVCEEAVPILHQHLYNKFIEAVDCLDNGGRLWEAKPNLNIGILTELFNAENIELPEALVENLKREDVVNQLVDNKMIERVTARTDFTSQIPNFVPAWWVKDEDYNENASFVKAVEWAQNEFLESIKGYMKTVWKARMLTREALQGRYETHESGKIIFFEKNCRGQYMAHLYDLERELGIEPVTFVIYREFQGSEKHRVKAIQKENEGFSNRKNLPSEFAGLSERDRPEELSGVIFIHRNLFLAGTKDFESAIRFAVRALEA